MERQTDGIWTQGIETVVEGIPELSYGQGGPRLSEVSLPELWLPQGEIEKYAI